MPLACMTWRSWWPWWWPARPGGAAGPRDLAVLLALADGLHDLAELVALAAGLHDLAELAELVAVAVAGGPCDLAELVAVVVVPVTWRSCWPWCLPRRARIPPAAPSGGLIPCRFRVPPPGGRSSYGWGRMGACMTTPPPIDDVRRLMLQGIYKEGPDDGDLVSLPDLVLQVAEFYGMVGPVSMKKAAGLVLNGLLGRDDWAGKPPASLDLYHATTGGNVLVRADALCGCDDAPACGHLSPRLQALNRLPLQVIMGRDLADLGSGPSLDSPAPRYLALLRSEALRAFGVTLPDTSEDLFRRMESAGVWPRRKAEKGCKAPAWTHAERDAAFELRSRYRVPDDLLAGRIGVTRQALNLAIGGARAPLTNSWPECWRPSPELLRRCGLPVPELTLQDACKPAPEGARKAA